MYYFLKDRDFNLEEYEFEMECNPRFTKKEHEIFDYFVANFKPDQEFSEFGEEKLKYIDKDIQNQIHSIAKKTIFCHIFKNEEEISRIYFNIFDVIVFEKNRIIYKFSNEISLTQKRGNIFSRINVLAFLKFKFNYTKEIFKLILRQNKRKGTIEFTLEEFKKILQVDETKYHRYYDFENKILNPTIKDIEVAEVGVWYEKIKSNNLKTSRIIGIKLHYTNIYRLEIHRDTNEILKMFAEYIEDFPQAHETVYSFRKINPMDKTIEYIQKNLDNIFKIKN